MHRQVGHLEQIIVEREQRIRQLNAALHRASGGSINLPNERSEFYHCPNAIEYPCQQPGKIEELEKKIKQLMEELENSQKQERFLHIETRKLNEELNDSKNKNGKQRNLTN